MSACVDSVNELAPSQLGDSMSSGLRLEYTRLGETHNFVKPQSSESFFHCSNGESEDIPLPHVCPAVMICVVMRQVRRRAKSRGTAEITVALQRYLGSSAITFGRKLTVSTIETTSASSCCSPPLLDPRHIGTMKGNGDLVSRILPLIFWHSSGPHGAKKHEAGL